MIKHQIFVNKHLPVQTQRNEMNICKEYSVCSDLLIKILQNATDVILVLLFITFQHDITWHLGAFTVYSTCKMA